MLTLEGPTAVSRPGQCQAPQGAETTNDSRMVWVECAESLRGDGLNPKVLSWRSRGLGLLTSLGQRRARSAAQIAGWPVWRPR